MNLKTFSKTLFKADFSHALLIREQHPHIDIPIEGRKKKKKQRKKDENKKKE